MKDRRKAGDRRSFRPAPAFPFVDSRGCVLHETRSRMPDRRLNSLQAEWLSMALVRTSCASKREYSSDGEVAGVMPLPENMQGSTA